MLKFKVLEVVARVPYQAWELAAYAALTACTARPAWRRIFDRVVQTRARFRGMAAMPVPCAVPD